MTDNFTEHISTKDENSLKKIFKLSEKIIFFRTKNNDNYRVVDDGHMRAIGYWKNKKRLTNIEMRNQGYRSMLSKYSL